MTKEEALKILGVIRVLEDEIVSSIAAAAKSDDPLVPTPFSPQSDKFAGAVAAMKGLPYSDDEVASVIERVNEDIEKKKLAENISSGAIQVLDKLKEIVPILFTL